MELWDDIGGDKSIGSDLGDWPMALGMTAVFSSGPARASAETPDGPNGTS